MGASRIQRRARWITLLMAGALLWVAPQDSAAKASTKLPRSDAIKYPLDKLPRTVNRRGRVRCPSVSMTRYRGAVIRYSSPVRVYVGFVKRLRAFEKLVRDAAIQVYGWAPRRIKHLGTYNCRRIRRWPTFLSEHGIGNGIDVAGFDFGAAPKRLRKKVPAALRWGFKVRLDKHWKSRRGVAKKHRQFLHLIGKRLIERNLFRVMLGPAEPGHHNHFHLDMAPWNIVNIF
jgi:hypothetical protein